MLNVPAPFPQVGSYALLIDTNLPASQQRAELVRIQRRDDRADTVALTFPLRVGASGFRIVPENELIDGTPLSRDEDRELTDLLNHLRGRKRLTPKLQAMADRSEAIRGRAMASLILESELAKLRALDARDTRRGGGSIGSRLPGDGPIGLAPRNQGIAA